MCASVLESRSMRWTKSVCLLNSYASGSAKIDNHDMRRINPSAESPSSPCCGFFRDSSPSSVRFWDLMCSSTELNWPPSTVNRPDICRKDSKLKVRVCIRKHDQSNGASVAKATARHHVRGRRALGLLTACTGLCALSFSFFADFRLELPPRHYL